MRSLWLASLAAMVWACSDPARPADDDTSSVVTIGVGGAGGGSGGGGAGGGSGPTGLPERFEVTGTIVDDVGNPVAQAGVLQGGRRDQILTTDDSGRFTIELVTPTAGGVPGIVAFADGYRSSGFEFYVVPTVEPVITLRAIAPGDNTDYTFMPPGDGFGDIDLQCGRCHTTFTRDFQQSKHRQAAQNPLVHDLYAGVAHAYPDETACTDAGGAWRTGTAPGTTGATDRCYLGAGVLPDLNVGCGDSAQLACDDPSDSSAVAFGQCADCHAPGMSGEVGGRDLLDITGLGFTDGVFCDTCHKVSDVDLSKPPGIGPNHRLVLARPFEPSVSPESAWQQVMYGPLVDVARAAMGAVVQPKFNEAQFCAGCHQQEQAALLPGDSLDPTRWPDGLPVHSTYQEWLDGPYADNTPCQTCHMPPHYELNNAIDDSRPDNQSIDFGYPREPEDKREHVFRGPLFDDPVTGRHIDNAVFLDLELVENGANLEAAISVTNNGCGHAVPTGEPMRSLVLLVTATGTGCGELSSVGGMTVPDLGGAHAIGTEGVETSSSGTTITWPAAAANALVGMTVRVTRPSGLFDDYDGIGLFAGNTLSASDKGMQIHTPVGIANIVATDATTVTLDAPLGIQNGDVLFLGDALPRAIADGTSRAYAGAAGYAFARVLTDRDGQRQVPHHRANDIASDNRIPPGKSQTTNHTFDATGCTDVTVYAHLLYRPHPISLAQERGWTANDYLIASRSATFTP